jgi:ABC-type transport system involved in multi-copper enzyme maturation permease subunit
MNLARTLVISTHVFREVVRDRALYLVGLYALALVLAVRLLPEVAATTEHKIALDFGLAAMTLLSLVIAVFVGTGLVNREIEKKTVLVMMAKPISRAEFIVGKHWGLTAVLALLVAAMTGIFLGIMAASQVALPLTNILLSSGFLVLLLSLITAVAITFGVMTSSLLATLLTFAVFLMGSFSRELVQLGKLSKNPSIELVTQSLYTLLPDLARLDLKNQAVYAATMPGPMDLTINALYGVLYIALLLVLSTAIFSRRQF